MKPEIKQLWVKALKSGKYEQGSGLLRRNNEFCCLGVLCDLYNKDTGHGQWCQHDNGKFVFQTMSAAKSSFLPTEVQTWAGINDCDIIIDTESSLTAAEVNDGGKDFVAIANLIEENL